MAWAFSSFAASLFSACSPRWGVISQSLTLRWHLGFPVTSLVCLCTQAQSGHSGIAWCAWGSRLYLPRSCVWWLWANTWYLSEAVKAPFSSLPRMASRQTLTELFTCQCWKVSAKISSDRCKWMDASLAFLCGDGSCHLAHLSLPNPTSIRLLSGLCFPPFLSTSVWKPRCITPPPPPKSSVGLVWGFTLIFVA